MKTHLRKYIAVGVLTASSLTLAAGEMPSSITPETAQGNRVFTVDFSKVSNELEFSRPLGFSTDHVFCGDLTVAAARSLNAGVLRYPEGERGDLYLWNAESPDHPKLSVGGADKSWTTDPNAPPLLSFDRFLKVCEGADALPLVILGIDAAIYAGKEPHADKAAILQAAKDWVAYARSKGYDGAGSRRIYWEIGNESYLKSITGAPAWKPAEYAAFFNEMVAELKTVDPHVQCGANGAAWHKGWWETMIPAVENQAAFFITHAYSNETNQVSWSSDEKSYVAIGNITPINDLLKLHPHAARRIMVTEMSSYKPGLHDDATWRVLQNLEMYSECLAQPHLECAVFWTAVWGRNESSTTSLFFSNYKLTQMGEGFQMLGHTWESVQQPWQSDGPVRCYSSCNPERTRAVVMLVNKSLSTQSCVVRPDGFQGNARTVGLSRLSLTAPEHGQVKCEENFEQMNIEPDKEIQLILPPLSATWLHWNNRGSDLYVSPKGSDNSDGSHDHPFATLAKARDELRKLPKDQAITVWLARGDYYFETPFRLEARDSGTATHPVTYRAVEGETPRLLGGRRLSAADFQPISDPATLARIPQNLRGKIVELDLAKTGVRNMPPYPDVFHDSGIVVDLFCDGHRLPLARYPKKGYMTIAKVLDNAGGPTDWRNPTASVKKVDPNGPGGTFLYRDGVASKFETWKGQLDRGVWLRGYWRVAWEIEGIRVKSIDTVAHTATFAKPISGGIGNKYTRPAGNGQESYWVMNLLEEVSEPGEWCLDFKDRKIYLYPEASLNRSGILLLDDPAPVISLQDASHLILQGLTIEANLGDGIRITGGEEDLVAGCTVRNVDKYAVVLDGGKNHTVLSNDLYHLGGGGVWLGGGDEAATPRIPAGHRVINNHIHDFAELDLIYAPGVNCGFADGGGGGGHHTAVGMFVAHNLIHDTPHGGVLFASMDSIFEYNEIYRWCLVSNDLGAFYSYDNRTRHFGNITFRYNFMHDSRIGDGIYFDNDHPDMKLIGNIACLRSDGKRGTAFLFKRGNMEKDGVPQAFDCRNNVAVACTTGFEFVSMLPHQGVIADNVAIQCAQPFDWKAVADGKTKKVSSYGTGTNLLFAENPGFKDIAHLDFRLNPNSQLHKELPYFEPIPVEKIGLYVDEYRKSLPTEEELDRAGTNHPQNGGLGYDILDRIQH